ncbi:MAG: SUMF1/EgtB/PvdO family nonheme iron enzyme, partial [Chloroflexota bacterium]
MKLDFDTRTRLRNILVPRLQLTGSRQQLVNGAFHDTGLKNLIIIEGLNPKEFASYLIDECLKYGEVAPGRHALVALLDRVREDVGYDGEQEIDALKATLERLKDAPTSPHSIETPAVTVPAPPPVQKPAISADELTQRTVQHLPQPFVWLEIPAGNVTLDRHSAFAVKPFMLAKYPVTNAQFSRFIDAGGYDDRRWWADGLWDLREAQGWAEPRYWQQSEWNGPEYPVVGVSWYEAVAFTRWLAHEIRAAVALPTEMQWQQAAQGTENRLYPYGVAFDAMRANTKEANMSRTTLVTHYENIAASPYGVVDMAGNVWEWCLNVYGEPDNVAINTGDAVRAVRGGSFRNAHRDSQSATRLRVDPDGRYDDQGFRVCVNV